MVRKLKESIARQAQHSIFITSDVKLRILPTVSLGGDEDGDVEYRVQKEKERQKWGEIGSMEGRRAEGRLRGGGI